MELKGVKKVVLDNGLTLLMEKRPGTKKAALIAGVKVGSVDETDGINGGSHFNEHLLFKSNRYRTARAIAQDLEYAGTVVNAYTTWKYTAFTAKAPSRHLPTAVEILYQAATNYDYPTEEFETERQVILTEIQNFINSPDRYSLTGLFIPQLFAGTPLEKKIEGSVASMGSVKKEELEDFKRKYYVPNNMVIAAAGRFDETRLVKDVTDLFESLDKKPLPKRPASTDLSNRKKTESEKRRDITQVYMCMGYRVPGYGDDVVHTLDVLSSILSEGLSSRMYHELREKRGIGYGVGSIYYPVGEEGMFITHVDGFDPKRTREAGDAITGIFRDLKTKDVPTKEFKGTKTLMISKHFDHLEKITDRAMALLETEIYGVPYDFREKEKHIKKVSKEDVKKAAKKYLTDDFVQTLLEPA